MLTEGIAGLSTDTWVMLGVGVVTIGATIWVTLYAARHRRGRILWRVSQAQPLLAAGSEVLHVLYGKDELTDPYIVVLDFVADLDRDIRTEAFEGHKVRFDLKARIVDRLRSPQTDQLWGTSSSVDEVLLFPPSLIRRRSWERATLIVDGYPEVTLDANPIADVDIIEGEATYTRLSLLDLGLLAALSLSSLVAAFGMSPPLAFGGVVFHYVVLVFTLIACSYVFYLLYRQFRSPWRRVPTATTTPRP